MEKNKEYWHNQSSNKGKLFVLSGPTGSGKTFAAAYALPLLINNNIERVVTFTSRPARLGETDGVDYNFLDEHTFKQKEKAGFFFETTCYGEQWYGSPQSMITTLDDGKSWLLVADRAGALKIKNLYPAAITIWVDVPSASELEKWLKHRNTANTDKRIAIAKQEIEDEKQQPHFDFHILNDYNTSQAGQLLVEIIKNKLHS